MLCRRITPNLHGIPTYSASLSHMQLMGYADYIKPFIFTAAHSPVLIPPNYVSLAFNRFCRRQSPREAASERSHC